MVKNSGVSSWLRVSLRRISRWQFVFVALVVGQILLYDASKLIEPEVVMRRWFAIGGVFLVSIIGWYLATTANRSRTVYRNAILAIILADIAFASFSVYTQRGMASRAVMLFVVPLVISAVFLSRAALYATAAICTLAYTASSVSYFVLNFNEGYKVELYGEVGFYSAVFFIIAGLLWVGVRSKQHR